MEVWYKHLNPEQIKELVKDLMAANEVSESKIKVLEQNIRNEISESTEKSLKIVNLEEDYEDLSNAKAEVDARIETLARKYQDLKRENDRLQENQGGEVSCRCAVSCPVCRENFDSGSRTPYLLNCPHLLCLSCLNSLPLVGSSRQCPMCRAPFALPSARKVVLNHIIDTVL